MNGYFQSHAFRKKINMTYRFQQLIIISFLCFSCLTSFAQMEANILAGKTITKSIPLAPVSYDTITPEVSIKGIAKKSELSSVDYLRTELEMALGNLNTELSDEELDYRVARILKVKKEETEADLLFIGKLDKIKKTIAYETLDNSKDYIKTAERFLDTLYNEDTEVSENFKSSTKERYDNYIAKEKVVKVRLNDLIVTELPDKDGVAYYKYSGFALLGEYHKQIRVEFFSDGNISRTDPKWIYKAAAEDNMSREITIEGVISEYHYGRKIKSASEEEKPISLIVLKEWLIENREQLINEFKK